MDQIELFNHLVYLKSFNCVRIKHSIIINTHCFTIFDTKQRSFRFSLLTVFSFSFQIIACNYLHFKQTHALGDGAEDILCEDIL